VRRSPILPLLILVALPFAASALPLDEARELLAAGKFDESISKFEVALRAGGPSKASVAVELIRAQVAAGRLISANTTITRYLRESPTDPQRGEMLLLSGRLMEAGGNLPEAVSIYRNIAEQTPAVPERADALVNAIRTARLLDNASLTERCLAEFTESFPGDPRSRDFLLQLIRYKMAQSDNRGTAEAIHRFKAAYPEDAAGAALKECWYLAQAQDFAGAVAAFEIERKQATFRLTPTIVSTISEAMRRDKASYGLIEPLAAEYEKLTGDPQFQVAAVEVLPLLNAEFAPKAVELGKRLLAKLGSGAFGQRLRIALADAYRQAKQEVEAEKILVEALAIDPSNSIAWDKHLAAVVLGKRPESHTQLLEQTLPKLDALTNPSLKSSAKSQVRMRLVQAALTSKDFNAALRHTIAFLEQDGISPSGPVFMKLAAEVCFGALAPIDKASEDAAAAVLTAKSAFSKAQAEAAKPEGTPAAKEAAEKSVAGAREAMGNAQKKADSSQANLEDARGKASAAFETVSAALEKFVARTMPPNGGAATLEAPFKIYTSVKRFTNENKRLAQVFQRWTAGEGAALITLVTSRAAGQIAKVAGSAEALLPKVLEIGGSLGLDAGLDIVQALAGAGQNEKAMLAAKHYLAKYPGATAALPALAQAAAALGAPKNREALTLIDDTLQKAGSQKMPTEFSTGIRLQQFLIAGQNRLLPEMEGYHKNILEHQVGHPLNHEFLRNLGITHATAGNFAEAKRFFLGAIEAAKPTGSESVALFAAATSLPECAGWVLPQIDTYLKNPKRGPEQSGVLLAKARLEGVENKKVEAALQTLHQMAARPGELAWKTPLPNSQLSDMLFKEAVQNPIESATAADLQALADIVSILGQASALPALAARQGQAGKPFEACESIARLVVGANPNGAGEMAGFVALAQTMDSINKPELAGITLRSAINRLTGIDSKQRAQASQALFSLSSKRGFAAVEIDEKLEWAPLLKSAVSFRMGDNVAAWKQFEANEPLFAKHEDKVPADYLRWVSDRLLQREDDNSRSAAEKILRRWIIANEGSKAVPEDEKAKTQLQLADLYFKTLRYDLSRSESASLMERFPNSPEAVDAQFRIGECYLNQKMYLDAAKIFEKQAKSKEKMTASRGEFLLGVLAQQRGDGDDAKARFRAVMDLAPKSDVADAILYRLSELYGQENRFSDELLLLRSIGLIGSSAKQWHNPGMPLNVVIQDADLGVSRGQSYVPVVVRTSSGDSEVVRLESGSAGKGFFRAELATELGDPKPGDGILQVNGSDTISYDYPDEFKKQFTAIAKPNANIRLASDAEFRISATEIKDEEEVSFEDRLRQQRLRQGKQVGTEFRQDYRRTSDLKPGNNIYLQVKDADRDVSKDADSIQLLVTAQSGSSVTATLTETGPHTGIFRGMVKTTEIPANIFASDRSINGEAVRAIDNDMKTAWEGLNDGRAPKFLVVDLKETSKLGELAWKNDPRSKDKLPLEYAVQKSNDMVEWTTVAATKGFASSTVEMQARISSETAANAVTTTVKLAPEEGRYLRMLIQKFSGTAPRIAEMQVRNAEGILLIPAKAEVKPASEDALRLTPSDRVTATYEDETSTVSPGKPRSLAQSLQATYFNGKIDFIAYDFKQNKGQTVPEKFIKQVRRVNPGSRVIVRVTDYDADVSDQRDKVQFTLKASDGTAQTLEATETEPFSGVFTKEIDIWSAERPAGIKIGPGVALEAAYQDSQNTDPGAPISRTASIEAVPEADAKVAFTSTKVEFSSAGKEVFLYSSGLGSEAAQIKPVAFRVPLTFEVLAPFAALDSFSEVKATLTTSGGSTVEVICPLAELPGAKPVRAGTDEALEAGRFVGQIFMNLGDKDSPPTLVLEPGDTRSIVPRRTFLTQDEQQLASVVSVLNLNGQDVISVSFKTADKESKDQARLSVPASVLFTDNGYEKPVGELYIGDKIYLAVHDLTADASPERDSVEVTLTTSRGEKLQMSLQETLGHSGDFTGSLPLQPAQTPTPGDDRMEAWFGDSVTLSYASKSDASLKVEKTINVVKGTDGNLLVFEKKYANERVAIESQFRMAEAYFELFKNYRTLKQDALATNSLNEGMQILKELSTDYPSKQYEARTDYLLGQFAQELKKFDEAIAYYKRIVHNHSESTLAPESQYKLGQCYEEKNDMDTASAEYVTLAYTWPESPLVANVVVRIAEYFYTKKEFPTAAEVSKKFVERFPHHEWAERMLFRAAQCWFKAEQFAKAGADFDLLVENYPRSTFRPDAIFWAGESYRSANQLEVAYRRYKRATWDYPESEAAKFARGKLVTPEMVGIADKDVQSQ